MRSKVIITVCLFLSLLAYFAVFGNNTAFADPSLSCGSQKGVCVNNGSCNDFDVISSSDCLDPNVCCQTACATDLSGTCKVGSCSNITDKQYGNPGEYGCLAGVCCVDLDVNCVDNLGGECVPNGDCSDLDVLDDCKFNNVCCPIQAPQGPYITFTPPTASCDANSVVFTAKDLIPAPDWTYYIYIECGGPSMCGGQPCDCNGEDYVLISQFAAQFPQQTVGASFKIYNDSGDQCPAGLKSAGAGKYEVKLQWKKPDGTLVGQYQSGTPLELKLEGDGTIPTSGPTATPEPPIVANVPVTCSTGGGLGIDTAIGCVPIDSVNSLTTFFLKWGLGLGGGIAILLIIYSGFLITTSAGNPQKIQAGKELLTAAIAGLVLLIFSVFILELIGIRILNLPGLV